MGAVDLNDCLEFMEATGVEAARILSLKVQFLRHLNCTVVCDGPVRLETPADLRRLLTFVTLDRILLIVCSMWYPQRFSKAIAFEQDCPL